LALPNPPRRAQASDYDLKDFYRQIQSLVKQHYKKATFHRLNGKIHFEYSTRIFLLHNPWKNGEWQDPHEERGPTQRGIYCDIEIRRGKYWGAAMVPQTFDKRYFMLALFAPYSERLDAHMYVHLKYPSRASDDFLNELTSLINNFEKYVKKHEVGEQRSTADSKYALGAYLPRLTLSLGRMPGSARGRTRNRRA
jgi:hypothetical protein